MAGATKVSYTKTGSIAATFDSKKIAKLLMDSAKATSTATSATVTINGVSWKMVGASATGKLTFTQIAKPETMEEANSSFQVKVNFEDTVSDNVKLSMAGNSEYDPGTKTTTWGVPEGASKKANTVFKMTEADIVDGAKITLGQGSTAKVYTLKVGRDSQVTGTKVIDLSTMEEGKIVLSTALSKIATTIGTATFKAKNAKGSTIATTFRVTYTEEGIGVFRAASASSTDKAAFNTLEKIANNFKLSYNKTTAATEDQNGLVLQIGDTSDSFNQMEVSIGDMHTKALGIDGIDISNQEGAAAAVQTIKDAINYVSSVRGDLGAVQNRLDHTANNLSVMAENIQDAESTIRDTDVAEEMMSYVKNNILIQSAQAMLAQANQVPQGVLQLLG